ncbi:GDSL-type esterase/lipase family protein [uncultured Alistipes sp.]|uniref:GDSL-type esterase/lipase family protein n=1 Tax=uncultured Alistipes sp. TaxID=538949 RepID=UPI003207A888
MKRITCIAVLVSILCPLLLRAQDSTYFRANEWRGQIEAYYEEDRQHFPEAGSILFVGSSSIRMWKDLESYFPEHRALSRGFGGAWISDVLYHMQRLVIAYDPAQIVLYAGENDLANGVSPAAVVEDVRCFLRLAEIFLPGVPVVVLSVKPSPFSSRILEKQRETNRMLEALCRERKQVTYVDVASLMFDAQGALRPELYRDDKLHMTPEAYRLWAEKIEPLLIDNK